MGAYFRNAPLRQHAARSLAPPRANDDVPPALPRPVGAAVAPPPPGHDLDGTPDPPPPSLHRRPPSTWSGSCVSTAASKSPGKGSKWAMSMPRKLVPVSLDDHTVTGHDNNVPIKAVPRRSTANLNRTKAHHEQTRRT
ncbi:hypothetical protein Raf01_42620 [Rugosimonospora africana]|uniref:Uncharacterized protein n=1 Tax=Rugosimonospora africana TaxID=556532 RepID=A0A8J3VRE2_9ACTN|nr:hypothetical protein Raf01_42620 [Rugosimonospora africana]